jgi:two-component system phosphate regulon response regulator OmpR
VTMVSDDAKHVLVVDDDNRIRTLLQRFLSEHGYRVSVAQDAADARAKLESIVFDLIVLDVMMPGESGVALAQSLRQRSDVPILMLTARTEAAQRVEGLEVGADDYLGKPFDPRELLLRMANVLKRRAAAPVTPEVPEILRFGPYLFHLQKMQLTRDGEVIRLTDRERRLMRQFAETPGETIPRHLLIDSDAGPGDRAVDVQINRLRRKIEPDPANPVHLVTVRGAGYRLVPG